jgi:hypothetical protein
MKSSVLEYFTDPLRDVDLLVFGRKTYQLDEYAAWLRDGSRRS